MAGVKSVNIVAIQVKFIRDSSLPIMKIPYPTYIMYAVYNAKNQSTKKSDKKGSTINNE